MPSFNSQQLLQELDQTVRQGIVRAEQFKKSSKDKLQAPPLQGTWTVAQHLFHLNFYASFYTEAIEACLNQAKSQPKATFRSGWLGNYFTQVIGPAEENMPLKTTMKSPENASPPADTALDVYAELEAYLGFQHRLLYLLQRAQQVDLGAHRVPISISRLIRLKLGDTFRFVIAHQERHLQHLERAGYLPSAIAAEK
ncbi:MAG: DinB family protein [Bacteroidota bacterium]